MAFLPSNERKETRLMAHDAVSQVIGRAVIDTEFRTLLFSNPPQALQGYDLSGDEVEALKNLKLEDLEDFSTKLDARITKRAWRG
jgi:hypothetical protein